MTNILFTVTFIALFLIWKKEDALNFFIKAYFFILSGYSLFITLQQFGFIVRKP